MQDEVVDVKVFDDEHEALLFEGKVSADVLPNELLHLTCFSDRGCSAIVLNENELSSFHGLQAGEVRATICDRDLEKFSGVLYKRNKGDVLRKSKIIPRAAGELYEMMCVCDLPHEECQYVFHHETHVMTLEMLQCKTLKHIPPSMAGMKDALQILRLSNLMELVSFPEELGHLENLRELSMERCRVEYLPASIGLLTQLETLSLTVMEWLIEIPEEIGNIQSLKKLWIEYCLVESLPESLARLQGLEEMSLICLNRLNALPKNFGQLSSLKDLWVEVCGMESLPESFGSLQRLERLYLAFLKNLRTIPKEMGQLTCLKSLKIENCPLEEIPKELGALQQLEKLELIGLANVRSLPDEIGNLSSLKDMNLGYCALVSIPRVGDLQQLTELTLSSLMILQEMPDEIGKLSSLKKLSIWRCHISKLPRSLNDLPSLSSLSLCWLQGHQICPEDLPVLSRLRELQVKSFKKLSDESLETVCSMLKRTLHLRVFELDVASLPDQSLPLKENGSIIKGNLEQYQDVFERNKSNFDRAMSAVVCMMAIKRWKRGLSNFPKEIVEMIAQMVWKTQCDIEAWTAK